MKEGNVHRIRLRANSGRVKLVLRSVIASIATTTPHEAGLIAGAECVEFDEESPWAEALTTAGHDLIVSQASDLPSILGVANYHFDWIAIALGRLEDLDVCREPFYVEGWVPLRADPPVMQCLSSTVEIYVWDDNELVVLVPAGSPHEGVIEAARSAAEREGAEVVG